MESGRKSRILIATGIYPPDIGGPATYSKLLFEELPKRGFAVGVLSFGEVRQMPRILRHVAYFCKVLRQGRKVDLIYAQDPVSVGLPSALAAKILGKQFILKVVGDYAWEQFQFGRSGEMDFVTPEEFQSGRYGWLTELRRQTERFVAALADKIVVPSEYLKKIVISWGIDGNKINVIYNVFTDDMSSETSTKPISREVFREEFGMSGTIILSAGRVVPWKGFKTLASVMPEIAKKIPDARLIIVGDGPEKENLQEYIDKARLEHLVLLAGGVSHSKLAVYLRACDLFVLNTGYEGLSHQLLEAMAAGAPIVTTDVGGNPELIEDGKSGALIKYNDRDALAAAIIKILSDKALADRLSENARLKVGEFSQKRMINGIIGILK
ncbi:MAG: glycosyltransferase family 4 protein [Patescibacteria group bacterium]